MNNPFHIRDNKIPILHNHLPRVLKFEKIKEYLTLTDGIERVLDYGSGDKPYETFLKTYFKEYISADFNPSNELHSKKPDFFINNIQATDISGDYCDCVIITEVLEHIYKPVEALKEIHRILKPGGIVIGSVPFIQNEHEIPYDYHRYTSFSIERMLSDSSFKEIKIDYIGDLFGVSIIIFTKYTNLIIRVLEKLHLRIFSFPMKIFFKIPEYLYYLLYKRDIRLGKYNYFKSLPFGFTFFGRK